MNNPVFVFTNAHKTRLGAILTQVSSMEEAKLVATVTGTINIAEKDYPQINLDLT